MLNPLNRILRKPNFGLLVLRVAIGAMTMAHGIPMFMGGSKTLKEMGAHMAILGINFMPVVWGFMAALAQTLGGFLFAIGLFFRPVCIVLTFTMVVASLYHWDAGHAYTVASHAYKMAALFLAMMFVGPGTLSFDKE